MGDPQYQCCYVERFVVLEGHLFFDRYILAPAKDIICLQEKDGKLQMISSVLIIENKDKKKSFIVEIKEDS